MMHHLTIDTVPLTVVPGDAAPLAAVRGDAAPERTTGPVEFVVRIDEQAGTVSVDPR